MNKLIITKMMVMFMFSTLLVSCNKDTSNENYDNEFTVYLANADMNGLVPVIIDLEGNKTETKIKNILDVLKQGVELDGSSMASLPKEVEIKEIKVNKDNAVINFSSEYTNQINIAEVLLGRSSIVKSLIELEGIDTVEFYVEGIPLKSVSGSILGKMGEDDIILNLDSSVEQKDTTLLTLYFSNEDGAYLEPVEYSIALNPDEQLERTVLNLLIEGPEDDNLMRTIPVETKIKNVSTNEGICTVDLSKEFVTSHNGGSTGELLTIYSIVNSLTELPNISQVKFLIEGEVKEQYKGHFMLNVLFEKSYDVLEKTE